MTRVEESALKEVSNIVRETLAERFADDEVLFGTIAATSKMSEYDEAY